MKVHSTDYFGTFIEVAEDTKVNCGTKPPTKDKKTVAEMQYEMIMNSTFSYFAFLLLFIVPFIEFSVSLPDDKNK